MHSWSREAKSGREKTLMWGSTVSAFARVRRQRELLSPHFPRPRSLAVTLTSQPREDSIFPPRGWRALCVTHRTPHAVLENLKEPVEPRGRTCRSI